MNHEKVCILLIGNFRINILIFSCWRSIAVPGEIHGYYNTYKNFASQTLSWSELIQPTIELIRLGYPTSEALAKALRAQKQGIINVMDMYY